MGKVNIPLENFSLPADATGVELVNNGGKKEVVFTLRGKTDYEFSVMQVVKEIGLKFIRFSYIKKKSK